MNVRRHLPCLPLALCAVLSACGPVDPGETTTEEEKRPLPAEVPFIGTPLAVAKSGPLELELYTRGPLEVGRNEVAYRLVDTETGAVVPKAALVQKPLMTMASSSHGCPTTDPSPQADDDGRFLGTIVPTMPSGAMGSWRLDVEVTPDGDAAPVSFAFGEVQVSERALPARKDLIAGEERFILTLNFAGGAPKVGKNDVVVTAHQAQEMGTRFPAQSDLTFKLLPEMPTMGHGSPGNVNPTHLANGDYAGVANFNRAGAWRVTLEVSRGGVALGKVVYDFTL